MPTWGSKKPTAVADVTLSGGYAEGLLGFWPLVAENPLHEFVAPYDNPQQSIIMQIYTEIAYDKGNPAGGPVLDTSSEFSAAARFAPLPAAKAANALTFIERIKILDGSRGSGLLTTSNVFAGAPGFEIYQGADQEGGALQVVTARDQVSMGAWVVGVDVIPYGEWVDMAFTVTGTDQQLFVNGTLASSTSEAVPYAGSVGNDWYLGTAFNGAVWQALNGYMEFAMLYDRVLSPEEISTLHEAPFVMVERASGSAVVPPHLFLGTQATGVC